jgi:cytochrome c oxidase subunit 4
MQTHPTPSIKFYVIIFAILLALTALTSFVATLGLGKIDLIIALTIAFAKACLIVLYFMHVRYSEKLIPLAIGAGIFWLGILFVLAFSDYLLRAWTYS